MKIISTWLRIIIPTLVIGTSALAQIPDEPEVLEQVAPTRAEITAYAVAGAIADAKVQTQYHVVELEQQQIQEYSLPPLPVEIVEEQVESTHDELSPRIYQALLEQDILDQHKVDYSMNPYYQRGDFNGDGDYEIAILLINKFDGSRSCVVIQNDDFSLIGESRNLTDCSSVNPANQRFTSFTDLFKIDF